MSSIIRAQVSRFGIGLLGIPLVGGVIGAIAGWVVDSIWPSAQAMMLVAWLEQIFVICVGVTASVVLTGDKLVELHEASSISFRTVQSIRATFLVVSGSIGAFCLFVPLHLLGVWPRDQGWVTILSPSGAVIIIVAVAIAVAAFAQTTSSTTIAVVATWIFLAFLWDPYVLVLAVQRGVPLLAAVALIAVSWRRLDDSENNIEKAAQV